MAAVSTSSLLRLAIPAVLSALLNNAFRVIDQYSVQWLGTDAQAAVASCTFVLIAAFACFALVSAGVAPLVGRATGAGDPVWQRQVVGNGLVMAALVSVGVFLVAVPFGAEIASLLGLQGEPARLAAAYLRWLGICGLPLALAPAVDAVFIAMGRTGVVLGTQVLASVLNGLLNWLFIYQLEMGIAGAAVATGLSRLIALVPCLWLLHRDLGLRWVDLRLGATSRVIARLGAPIAANTMAYALVYWALLAVAISPLGPVANAALGIGFSALEGFTWPAFFGLSLAVSSEVGRQLGAGRVDQAERVIRLALPMSTAMGLTAALAFYFLAEPLTGLFTEDPAVQRAAVIYARALAFSQVFVAWESLAEGVLEGSGATRAVFWWSAPINLLRVPLGWYFAFGLGWGALGVWWAINLTSVVKALGKGSAVAWGRWRTVRLAPASS